MTYHATAILTLACIAAATQAVAADADGLPLIPRAYQGRWADRPADCAQPFTPDSSVVTITARGWSGWEEGGYVTGADLARGKVRAFAVMNQGPSDSEAPGVLALQLTAPRRLAMTFTKKGEKPVRYPMTRCR